MPRKGVLNLTFFSGGGIGRLDCAPNVEYRRSLLEMVRTLFIGNMHSSNNAHCLMYVGLDRRERGGPRQHC